MSSLSAAGLHGSFQTQSRGTAQKGSDNSEDWMKSGRTTEGENLKGF